MLTESYVASVQASGRPSLNSAAKDIGIQTFELQPTPTLRSSLKKSSTATRCLAVSPTHVFAAQTDKAVVHVYNREKGNQEAVVPFHERIHSLALAGSARGILVLGTEGGKLILWEISSGRQVITTASHLQPVISIAVDPSNNFILSASTDSNIQVWSLPGLLSFSQALSLEHGAQSNGPIRTLSNHRTAITDIIVGHSHNHSNIAISVSKDKTINVWAYQTGALLHTFLLPSTPTCLELDAADRAVYVGFEDGSVASIDFVKYSSSMHALHDPSKQYTPTQILPKDVWSVPSADFGAAKCLSLSYDGTTLLSGHESGKIATWDVARARYSSTIAEMPQPVSNIHMLTPTGSTSLADPRHISMSTIVKPRFDQGGLPNQASGTVPANYSLQAVIAATPRYAHTSSAEQNLGGASDEFQSALNHPSIPASLISAGLAELAAYDPSIASKSKSNSGTNATIDVREAEGRDGTSAIKDPLLAHSGLPASTPESIQKMIAEYESTRRQHVEMLAAVSRENTLLREQIARSEAAKLERAKTREGKRAEKREAWMKADRKGGNADRVVEDLEMEDASDDGDDALSTGTEDGE